VSGAWSEVDQPGGPHVQRSGTAAEAAILLRRVLLRSGGFAVVLRRTSRGVEYSRDSA